MISGVRASSMRMLSTSSTIAQVVEAELGVRAVGHVGRVGDVLLLVGLHVLQHADGQPETVVDRAHPLGVAAGEVVVDGDEMHALAGQRVEDHREGRGQRLALAGLHLGDVAAVQDHATDELHVEVAHAHGAPADLAHDGEGLRKQVAEGLALARPFAQRLEALAQLVVGFELQLGLVGTDAGDPLLVLAELL
jgi:hypothetical protein